MEQFYRIISSFKFLLVLAIVCLAAVLLMDFYLKDIPELFDGGKKIGVLIYNLCLAYLGSFIFYFFVVHLKTKRDKLILDPYMAQKTKIVVHSGKILIKFLLEASKNDIENEYPTEEELNSICLKINPNSNVEGWHQTNWLKLFKHYILQSEKGIKAIYEKIPFLDSKLIRLLGDLQSTPHYNSVNAGPQLSNIQNTNLNSFSKHLFQYLELTRELENYAMKNIYGFKTIDIGLTKEE